MTKVNNLEHVLPDMVSDVELIEPGNTDVTEDSGWNLICSSCIALNNPTTAKSQLAKQHTTFTIQV